MKLLEPAYEASPDADVEGWALVSCQFPHDLLIHHHFYLDRSILNLRYCQFYIFVTEKRNDNMSTRVSLRKYQNKFTIHIRI